jgi:acetylornithine deacetylase/succinyl-diaminopimelate desuccinylase-like protein
MLPVDTAENVQQTLVKVLADPEIHVSVMTPAKAGPSAPMNARVMEVVTAATSTMWPGVRVIPEMSTGGTDAVFLRNAGIPTYGVDGIFGDEDDVRAHGRDERILVNAFYESLEFMYKVVTGLAGKA